MHGDAHHHLVNKGRRIKILDDIAYVFGVLGPFVSLPQIYTVWVQHSTAGISLISWTAFGCLSIFWCSYAIAHKEKPLIVSQGLWAAMNFAVAIGVLIYR